MSQFSYPQSKLWEYLTKVYRWFSKVLTILRRFVIFFDTKSKCLNYFPKRSLFLFKNKVLFCNISYNFEIQSPYFDITKFYHCHCFAQMHHYFEIISIVIDLQEFSLVLTKCAFLKCYKVVHQSWPDAQMCSMNVLKEEEPPGHPLNPGLYLAVNQSQDPPVRLGRCSTLSFHAWYLMADNGSHQSLWCDN